MKTLKLTRKENNLDNLFEMISILKNFLKEDVDSKNMEWMENLETILNFQEKTGSFKLVSDYNIPSDARVDFCHMPTYICTAILMKAYLIGDLKLSKKIEKALIKGLTMSCLRNLRGHGYEWLKGQIEALDIFMEAGLREFIDLHGDLNPNFTKMILDIQSQFIEQEKQEDYIGPWGENYYEDIIKINKYFKNRQVFVYGTLMRGESNHYFLKNSTYITGATVDGYEMYDVGYYPAIISGKGKIIGELYMVSIEDMPSIDRLEGEGSLYIRKCELIKQVSSEKTLAYIYEFNQDVGGLEKINSWKDYVWYVSYGSNMLYERFICYIQGGNFEDSSYREHCRDASLPIATKTLEIPYEMYFGNYSRSWNGGGVSFLDTTKKGKTLAVAYLITREQFEHVAAQENSGRFPNGEGVWYEDIIILGELDGYDLITITNKELRPYNKPCEKYLETLIRGIKENWPNMSEEDITNYLNACNK